MVICDKVNKFILHDVDLHIPQGVTLGIIGASIAGKTTFLKLISVLFADIPVFDERLSIIDCLEEIRIMYGMKQRDFDEPNIGLCSCILLRLLGL